MAKETLDAIKRAEELAVDMQKESRKQAEQIINDAKAQKETILKNIGSEVKQNDAKFKEEALKKVEEIIKQEKENAVMLKKQIQDTALKNKDDVINKIIDIVVS